MGTLTLANFRANLIFDLKNRNDAAAGTTYLDGWINAAYSWMCQPGIHKHRELGFRHTITLVSGTNEYSLDATTVGRRVNGIRYVAHYQTTSITATAIKRRVSPRSVQWMMEKTTPPGAPTIYAWDGELLLLYGVPGANENGQKLRVGYWGEPTPLSAATDPTVVSPYFDRVLRKACLAFALEDLGARDLALEARQEAVSFINELPDNDIESDDDSGHEVGLETGPRMLA